MIGLVGIHVLIRSMKFSKAWLQTYSKELLPDTVTLRDRITFNAFEVEEVIEVHGDDIFDIKVLPNRAHDALSHRGMGRDITALLGTTFVDPEMYYNGPGVETVKTPVVSILDEKACTRFMSVRIDGITVTDSPLWLKERLEAIGQRSINSIVDITNYVQFAINKPMHAYDRSLVEGETLIARYAKEGETLRTLDDKELVLDASTLVIADREKPLGLAGIKGGKFSGVSAGTASLIIESANFNSTLIRKTAQKYGIRTDASKRFENEISSSLVEEGLRMTIALIQKLNKDALVSPITDVYPVKEEAVFVDVSLEEINSVLGTIFMAVDVEVLWKKLGFSFTKADSVYHVSIPPERLDLRIKEDLIEEVARVYGLSNIKGVMPVLSGKGAPQKRLFYENKIKNILHAHGFSEVMTYSFGDVGDVEIVKGLATDKEKLRTVLAGGVEKAFQMNMLNAPLLNVDVIRMYEFGNIFTRESERRHFALIIDDGKKKSVFTQEVAAILEEIKTALSLSEVIPVVFSTKPYIVEVDFDSLIEFLPEPTAYEPLDRTDSKPTYKAVSPYPFIVRDIAVWVPSGVTWESIHTLMQTVVSPLIVRIDCFDTFSKEIDGVLKTSYAFRVVLQSFERTLTDIEANVVAEQMYSLLKEKGYEIR